MKEDKKDLVPMRLQFFAEGGDGNSSQNTGDGNTDQNSGNGNTYQNSGTNNNTQNDNNTQQQVIDYDKLQTMIDNATAKKEDIVLRDYFKQQGMTREEVKQAVDTYKATRQQQNQQSEVNTSELETKMAEAQKAAQAAKIELEATKVAMSLGIDSKTLTYVLKMADMSNVMDKDGKLNSENIKTALNKVLDDIPALKNVKEESKGFQIGGSGQQNPQGGQQQTANIPSKRWNRFN